MKDFHIYLQIVKWLLTWLVVESTYIKKQSLSKVKFSYGKYFHRKAKDAQRSSLLLPAGGVTGGGREVVRTARSSLLYASLAFLWQYFYITYF